MPTFRGVARMAVSQQMANISAALIVVAIVITSQRSALAQPFAYVTDNGSGTVSVLNTSSNEWTFIPVGAGPLGVAVNPVMPSVYIGNNGEGTVSVIDAPSSTVVATIPVGSLPAGIVVSNDGARAYVANNGDGTLSAIDTATNTVSYTVNVGSGSQPLGVAINPSGTRAYIAKASTATLAVVNTNTQLQTAEIALGVTPYPALMAPDGSKVYVGSAGGSVAVVDAAINLLTGYISIPSRTSPCPPGDIKALAISPDGLTLYAAVQEVGPGSFCSMGFLSVLDAATGSEMTKIILGYGWVPTGVSLNAAATRAYVVNKGVGTVSVIDTATQAVITTIIVVGGSAPTAFGQFLSDVAPVTTSTSTSTTSTSNSITTTSSTTSTTVPEETGFIPPDAVSAKCEDGVAKATIKLATAIGRCHQKAASAAFQDTTFGEEACEGAAKAKYNGATAKLFTKSVCPPCLVTNAPTLRDQLEASLDQLNALPYCAGAIPLP